MKRYRLGMVAAEFNFEVTSLMIERAKAEAEFLEVDITRTILVPGVFDMPLAIKTLLQDPEIDAVITLGAVIEGETEHDEVVVAQASRRIMDLSTDYDKPVAFGITGPGMTELQAMDRIEKGRDVVDVAVKMLKRLGK
ncbi:MAG: 6,7-dimethyl-8-ribityllumazine synthase [Candidatus Methanomethylophilaceae archaeon]|nr:6,7-dimethyl-8-ribityllumazine synthase [Thermoplasmata archaeon]MBQ2762257.1 6,7-dimethyl-8-ribityllumazine synthase [Candidatus Methanomethylophilaceae archaeon]